VRSSPVSRQAQLKVVANHAFEAGKLDEKGVKTILADVSKILK
jgi:hypothetical protein